MTILHRVDKCPKCGWPSHANSRGRMMCCTGVREKDIPKIRMRIRRGNAAGRSSVVPAVQSPRPQQVSSRLKAERAELSVRPDRSSRLENSGTSGKSGVAKLRPVAFGGENPSSITPQNQGQEVRKERKAKSELSSAETEEGAVCSLLNTIDND